MKFSLIMFFFFLLSCGNINIPADLNNNKKDSNIKMKVTGKPNIKQKK